MLPEGQVVVFFFNLTVKIMEVHSTMYIVYENAAFDFTLAFFIFYNF